MISKYFLVDNKALSDGIAFASNTPYYTFTKDNGNKVYSFPRTEEVVYIYKWLMERRRNNK